MSAAGLISLGAITVPGDIVLHSTQSGGVSALALSAGKGIRVTATGETGNLKLTTLSAKAGALTLAAGGTLTATNATATGHITLDAAGNTTVGALTSSTGIVDLETTAGTLTTGAVSGASGVWLKSSGNLSTGALTSLNANVNARSLTGAVTITSAKAKTALLATSSTGLKLTSYTVSAGTAHLTAGTDFTATTGTAYGGITIQMEGIGSLGTQTSTNGSISATSSLKGLSFTTLKAATGITLRAKVNMGLGLNPAFALFGTTLDAGTGAVDAQTTAGNVQFGKLLAKSNSTVNTNAGNLKITTVTLPAPFKLTATASGTRTLPKGY
jgi:hypothetical protein